MRRCPNAAPNGSSPATAAAPTEALAATPTVCVTRNGPGRISTPSTLSGELAGKPSNVSAAAISLATNVVVPRGSRFGPCCGSTGFAPTPCGSKVAS